MNLLRIAHVIAFACLATACTPIDGSDDHTDPTDTTARLRLKSTRTDPACVDVEVSKRFELNVDDSKLRCDDSRVDVDACAGEAELIAFEYESDRFFLWINFKPELVDGPITEARLRENFQWLWYEVKLPGPGGDDEPLTSDRIFVKNLDDAEHFAFVDGRIELSVRTTVDELTRWVEPKGRCFDTDEGTRTCACKYPVSMPVTADLDLAFPM